MRKHESPIEGESKTSSPPHDQESLEAAQIPKTERTDGEYPASSHPLFPLLLIADNGESQLQWFLVVLAILSSIFLFALDNTITADVIPV